MFLDYKNTFFWSSISGVRKNLKGCLEVESDTDFGLVAKFWILDSASHRLNHSQKPKNDVGND